MEGDDNTTPPQANGGQQQPQQQHIRLACQACQRKKIKCDRLFPCGQCTRSGLQCVPSTRKPRARHAGKRAVDGELRTRIAKLESLVESLSGDVGNQEATPGRDEVDVDEGGEEAPSQSRSPSVSMAKYVGTNFWMSLTGEVQALRDALEEEAEDEADTPSSPSNTNVPSNGAEWDLLIMPPGTIYVMPGALPEPDQQTSNALTDVFCEYVNCMFMVFHVPTLRAFMVEGKPYLDHDHTAPGTKALKAVVWYSAVNAMSEAQCQMMLGQSKADLMKQYKRLVDVALSQADLMVTNDLTTLQAFAMYVAASRNAEGSRRMFTLAALAVRIARNIGLDYENIPATPFMTELRRRLWHFIRYIDVYGALDRGSQPTITTNSYDTPIPRNVNDADFDEGSTTIPEREGVTDMAYAQLIYDAISTTNRLTVQENKATIEQRMQFAQDFENTVKEKYWKYCDLSKPFHRLVLIVSRSMAAAMKLRAIRPLNKHPSSVPPRVDSPDVLRIAIDSMRESEAVVSDEELQQYRWMNWVQWHALAVALAGLCSIRDTDLAREAWEHVETSYARNARIVADSSSGMLWRPIEKLYKKASAFRDHGKSSSISQDTKAPVVGVKSISPPNLLQQDFWPTPPSFTGMDTNMLNLQQLQLRQQQQQQQQTQLQQPFSHAQYIPGAMPTTGVMNNTMDLDLGMDASSLDTASLMNSPFNGVAMDTFNGWSEFRNGDMMSWTDFEQMLQDLNDPQGQQGQGGYM